MYKNVLITLKLQIKYYIYQYYLIINWTCNIVHNHIFLINAVVKTAYIARDIMLMQIINNNLLSFE